MQYEELLFKNSRARSISLDYGFVALWSGIVQACLTHQLLLALGLVSQVLVLVQLGYVYSHKLVWIIILVKQRLSHIMPLGLDSDRSHVICIFAPKAGLDSSLIDEDSKIPSNYGWISLYQLWSTCASISYLGILLFRLVQIDNEWF